MSKLTDKISYLLGLAEGMKLNPDKDSHRLILGLLDVVNEMGDAFEALAESHQELSDYVDSIDEDLADLEANLYDDEDEKAYDRSPEAEDEIIEYECPHCGATIPIDPADVDFDEDALCPRCGKELFPELPEDAEEPAKDSAGDSGEESMKESDEDSGKESEKKDD